MKKSSDTLKSFGTWLSTIRIRSGFQTQRQLAEATNISPATISRLEAGIQRASPDTLRILSRHLDVSYDELLTKAGYWSNDVRFTDWMEYDDLKRTVEGPHIPNCYPVGEQVRIPILGVIRAGAPILAVENIEGYDYIDADLAKTGEYFYLRVIGDSMAPKIQDGYLVLIRKQDHVDEGDVAVVIVDDENATLKRVYRVNGTLVLKADNPNYNPIILKRGNVKIIGKAIEFKGKL